MTIVLDKPEQITAWVLLSRRYQIQMHLKGYAQKGLAAWLRKNFPEVGSRYVKDYVVAVEFALMEAGAEVDYSLVNVHVVLMRGGMYFDRGVYANMDEASTPENLKLFSEGRLQIVLTTDEVREANGEIYVMEQ